MKKKFSLKNQILITLLIFIISVLGMIYFFQTTLLDTVYKNNKIRQMETIADTIITNLKQNRPNNALDNISLNNEVSIRIVSNSFDLVGVNKLGMSILGMIDDYQVIRMANEIQMDGGKKLFNNIRFETISGIMPNLYIYGRNIKINGESVTVLVASNIIPMDATVQTIADQYSLIVVIVIVATLLLALFLSRFIIRPIDKIKEEANGLPYGKYNKEHIKTTSSELNNLNDVLASANEQINKADIAKKELMANISHDLRTPLTMIAGYGEMMKDIPEENNNENIDVIIKEAKRLSTLVDDLLDISKWQSGKTELNKKDVSVNELLKDVYSQYSVYCRTRKIKYKLTLIDDQIINIDAERIKQVLYNFMNNAINYNTKRSKMIELGEEIIDGKLRIYVYDNGIGIDDADKDKVFDRYYKVDKEHKRARIGSGIGLSLCKEILVAHNLNYGVQSKLGEYSKFYFDI